MENKAIPMLQIGVFCEHVMLIFRFTTETSAKRFLTTQSCEDLPSLIKYNYWGYGNVP